MQCNRLISGGMDVGEESNEKQKTKGPLMHVNVVLDVVFNQCFSKNKCTNKKIRS